MIRLAPPLFAAAAALLPPAAVLVSIAGPAQAASPAQTTFTLTNREATYARVSVMYAVDNQCVGPGQSRTWTLQPSAQYHVTVDAANNAACTSIVAGSNVRWDVSSINGFLRGTYGRRFALDIVRPLPTETHPLPLSTCGVLRTINLTQDRIWVTVYDAAQISHLDYGWVEPCSIRDWRAGRYLCGSYYHARAEVKNADLSANIYDTRVQVSPGISGPSNVVTLKHGQGNYYWDHNLPSFAQTVNGDVVANGCEAPTAASSPMKSVTLHFANNGATPVRLHATYTMYGGNALENQCVGAQQARDFKMAWDLRYEVTAEAATDANCLQTQGGATVVKAFTDFGTRGADTISATYSYRYAIDAAQ